MTAGEPFPLRGPAGALEAELHRPAGSPSIRALVAHPHPLYGGTMDNAVVMQVVRAVVAGGGEALRFNFRGVGRSAGEHDAGRGERLDLAAAAAALAAREPSLPLYLVGYSFGAMMTLEHLTRSGMVEPAAAPAGALLLAPPLTHYEGRSWGMGSLPLVVVYGDRDQLTPPALVDERARSWSDRVRFEVLRGAGHDLGSFSDPDALQATLERSLAFLHPDSTAPREASPTS